MQTSTKVFLVLLALILFLGAGALVIAKLGSGAGSSGGFSASRSGNAVLHVDLQGAWPEQDPSPEMSALLGVQALTYGHLVQGLHAAAEDPDIAAIELEVGSLGLGWGRTWEVRQALLACKAAGKRIHVHLGQVQDGGYYLASVADHVTMARTSVLWLDGIRSEVPFYSASLAKVGVVADLEQIGAYKNAADSYTRADMTDAHRQATESLLDGLFTEMTEGIGESLGRDPAEIDALVSDGPYAAPRALEVGLVHQLAFADEASELLDEALDAELARVDLEDYVRSFGSSSGSHSIAVIHAVGTIVPGPSQRGLFGGSSLGSQTIAHAIEQAVDDGADAIVLRVDSPGGSPGASDEIWRQLELAQDDGVPVVVSMSDVAASGGYWVAMGADAIVAAPTTITGSIGIYGGKYVTSGFQEKIDMNVVPVQRGENAGFFSGQDRFTDEQRGMLLNQLGTVYQLFLEKTAEGRGLADADAVDRVARGRVWTGKQALDHQLIDILGGLDRAVEEAKNLASIDQDAPVRLPAYPRPPSLFEVLTDPQARAAVAAEWHRGVARSVISELPQAAIDGLDQAQLLRLLESESILAVMPYRISAD
ncbi:MAG: S49 family peptidase [Acidobacteriota bacterium]